VITGSVSKDGANATPRSGAQMLERAMAVLECFESRPALGASQAARTLGLSVSTTHRLLKTLCAGGLLVQDGSGRYRLGPRTAMLGALASQRLGFDAARPLLEHLAALTGGAVMLGVLDDGALLTVMTVAAPAPDQVTVLNGARSPLHACAMGKSVIAHSAELQPDLLGGLARVTDRTITDVPTLARQLSEIREQGWALNEGELSSRIRGIAAPVFSASGQVTAAVAIAVSRSQASEEVPGLAREVRRSAENLRAVLAARSAA
jgi:IclR family acetate operon transcriptional repressor